MTPKEKAFQLIGKFTFASIYFTNGTDGSKLNAKTCALIAVHEILNSRPSITESQVEYQNFWQEVKQEINKL